MILPVDFTDGFSHSVEIVFYGSDMHVAENPAQDFVDAEFAPAFRPFVPPALRRVYGVVDVLIKETEWLNNPSGKCQRGQLVVKAVEQQFVKLIQAGSLPFDFSYEFYAARTGKHLVMRTGRSRVTINQVPNPGEKPRYARFRDNYGINNTKSLFREWDEAAKREATLRHLVVLHGYQDLTFATVGLPHPDKARLVYETSNLLNTLYEVSGGDPTVREGPTEAPDPEDIDDLERVIRDQGL